MRVALLFVPFFLFAGCGDPANRLYGSLSQDDYPLDFDKVQATLVGDQVTIAYLRSSGAKTAKVTVSIGDIQPVAGMDIDMTSPGVNGLPRGTVQRVEAGGTTDFPLKVGKIHFNQEPVANADISGLFRTTLANPDGRTLNGNFQAKVEAL
jgi:hypothetical protein